MDKKNFDGYLDVLFAHRNKSYGAYELRTSYNKRMLFAGIITSAFALFIFAWFKYFENNNFKISNENIIEINTEVDLRKVEPPKVLPKVEEKIKQEKLALGRTAKTQQFNSFKVVKDNKLIINKAKKLNNDALAGPVDNEGLKDGNAIALDKSKNDGPINMDQLFSKKGENEIEVDGQANEKKSFVKVEEMPSFPGGEAALMDYLQNNIRYPKLALENETQGKVFISFVIDKEGNVTEISIVRALKDGCSEEAMRVIKAMPKWKPGVQNGFKVKVKKVIPVSFALTK